MVERSNDLLARLRAAVISKDASALRALGVDLPHAEFSVPGPDILQRFRSAGIGAEGPTVGTVFTPASIRPAAYPTGIPFLPLTLTMAVESEDRNRGALVQYHGVAHFADAIANLTAQSEQTGWKRSGSSITRPGTHTEHLERGNQRRILIGTTSTAEATIWLMDVPTEAGGSGLLGGTE